MPAGPRPIVPTIGRIVVFVLLFVGMTVAAQGLVTAPVSWLVSQLGIRVRMDELVLLVAALVATGVMIRMIDHRPWRDVGMGAEAARPRVLGWGTVFGGGAIAGACLVLLLVGWLRVSPSSPGSSLAAALAITAFLLPAALYEEVVCRGYLLTAIRDAVGTWWAVGITSALFGLLHAGNVGATVQSVGIVTLAGIFLAAIRVVFDSLFAAWTAHLAWNWVMAVPLHAPVSGMKFEAPDYRTVSTGPEWVTGGSWGPEGGLAAALGMVAALAFLHMRHRRSTARLGREES